MGPLRYFALILTILAALVARADGGAAFDLAGPKVEVKVTRDGKTLPVSEVPNLKAGDRIWIHPQLPQSQSVHYLLIAAFLRGPTNPPSENWFIRAETWRKEIRQEGIVITVPTNLARSNRP